MRDIPSADHTIGRDIPCHRDIDRNGTWQVMISMRDVIPVVRQVALASEQRLAYMYIPSVKRRPLERLASARTMKT
jgi:hypothetical protein